MRKIDNQTNREIVAMIFKAENITAEMLKKALKNLNKSMKGCGKQSFSDLAKQGEKLQSIEITEKNIKSFERTARKYDLDYALKKDTGSSPPIYFVFFKGSSLEEMEKAFQEYSNEAVGNRSVKKQLKKSHQQEQDKNKERVKEHNKDRGMMI